MTTTAQPIQMGDTVRVAAWMRALLACERLDRALSRRTIKPLEMNPTREAQGDGSSSSTQAHAR